MCLYKQFCLLLPTLFHHCLLACIISHKKYSLIFLLASLYTCLFFSGCFKFFFSSLFFSNLTMTCHSIVLHMSCAWCLFGYMCVYNFHYVWECTAYYFFHIFSVSFLPTEGLYLYILYSSLLADDLPVTDAVLISLRFLSLYFILNSFY